MRLFILSRRHSSVGSLCDVHKGYAKGKELVAKLLVDWESGRQQLGVCRTCARALLGAATATGKKP